MKTILSKNSNSYKKYIFDNNKIKFLSIDSTNLEDNIAISPKKVIKDDIIKKQILQDRQFELD